MLALRTAPTRLEMLGSESAVSSQRLLTRGRSFRSVVLAALASLLAASCVLNPKTDDLPGNSLNSGPGGDATSSPDIPAGEPPLVGPRGPDGAPLLGDGPDDSEDVDAGTATTLGKRITGDAGAATSGEQAPDAAADSTDTVE